MQFLLVIQISQFFITKVVIIHNDFFLIVISGHQTQIHEEKYTIIGNKKEKYGYKLFCLFAEKLN